MRMKSLPLLACLMLPLMAQAQSTQKYFGYFGGDYVSNNPSNPGGPSLGEIKDHTNLYSIEFWSGDTSLAGKTTSENYVLGQLAAAKAAHVHAIVPATPFVFQGTGTGCRFMDPDAARGWASFAQKMVDQGYLVPNDPVRSTVVAVYLVDEPNGDGCLDDVNDAVNPILQNAINAIRNFPVTGTLPMASILTTDFKSFKRGIEVIDWLGFDQYGDSDAEWAGHMSSLKNYAPGKKFIVVPGAMQGCPNVSVDSTGRFTDSLTNDPDVVWLAPFMWKSDSSTCLGVRDLPSLRATYTNFGLSIKMQQCNSSPAARQFCQTQPDLYYIDPMSTGSGMTEVHILDAATGYSTFKLHAATALQQVNPDQVSFAIGDANNDGKTDVYAISRYGNGTPNVEVHILDGATNYSTFLGHYSTSLAAVPGALAWTFDVGDYNKDGKPDLYAFKKVGGGSGKTEVHIYSGADGFTTALGHFALPMPSTGDDDAWEFHVADVDRDGIPDVVAIAKKNGVTTEVHVVSGASNYTSYSLETGTALPGLGSDSRWVFGVNDYDADGQTDLFAINKIGTQGLEVHVLKGSAYQDYLLHAATPLGTMPSDSSKTFLINK